MAGLKFSPDQLAKMLAGNEEMSIDRRFSMMDVAPAVRQNGGASQVLLNKAAGQDFENRLNFYHAELYHRGVWVVKQEPIARFGLGGAVYPQKGAVDYIAYTRGVTIHFDAKTCTDSTYHIPIDSMHQLTHLKTARQFGQIAGYVVWWTRQELACWHPVETVDGSSVRQRDGIALIGVDWLAVIKNIMLQ